MPEPFDQRDLSYVKLQQNLDHTKKNYVKSAGKRVCQNNIIHRSLSLQVNLCATLQIFSAMI